MKKAGFIFLTVFVFFSWAAPAQAQEEPVYNIENVTGDLYRFQSGGTYGVFLVTDEGIILADPISHDTAVWLKGELDRRFGLPVKYVIYSHDHADHTSGGEVFADTATFIGHVYAKPKIEESGHTVVPGKRFPRSYRITLGGKAVDLIFFGASHSDNLITVYFPEEKAVFLVDIVGVKRLPYKDLPDFYFPATIAYLQKVEELDFEILLPGHGPAGTREDLIAHKNYMTELYNQVARAFLAGLSLEETKTKINLEHYFHWAGYDDWQEANIEGMYRIISNIKEVEVPELEDYETPIFPPNAAQMRFVGWVLLKFDVNEEGETENITVFDADAESLNAGITRNERAIRQFEKAAIRAAKKTSYAPGLAFEGLFRWDNFPLPPQPGDNNPFSLYSEGFNRNAIDDVNFREFLIYGVGGRISGVVE